MTDKTTDIDNAVFIDASQVRIRYGNRSHMWLWRTQAGDKEFPKPLVINKRNYWRLADLLAWEARRTAHAT